MRNKESKIKYITKNKIEYGCNDGITNYFYYNIGGFATCKINILKAIDNFIWGTDKNIKKFICFDQKLDSELEESQLHLMTNFVDKMYKGDCFVVMLDEHDNPSLYSIELRDMSPWKKTEYGTEYYVSSNTGWVYTFYQLKTFDKEHSNTDMVCIMLEFSKESAILESEDEDAEVMEIIGWSFTTGNQIPYNDFELIIEDFEKRR